MSDPATVLPASPRALLRYACGVMLALLMSAAVLADADDDVQRLLAADAPPDGVVFEIVAWDGAALNEMLPRVKAHIERLRQRFPRLDVAVVSHGKEQFGLLNENLPLQPAAHDLARDLLGDFGVPVEVCGTHAGMYGHDEASFPDYVDVVAAGPARIRDYQEMGYALVVMP